MGKLDAYELEVLQAYEAGRLAPVATKAELQKMRVSARATAIKDKRVNIRLSSVDLLDIQAKALEEGMPYQTLIASILHKYVTGRLSDPSHTQASPQQRPNPRARRGPTA
jgi:predicted DNA binding CopG/RHH family protein